MTTTGEKDMPAHASTYTGFLSLMKIGAIASFVIGMLIVFLLAN